MKNELAIKQAIDLLNQQDKKCPVQAHLTGRTCFDIGHAIRGTWRAALEWVLEYRKAPPWQ